MKHPGPLAGVRVIDLTSMVMGPYCTQVMADMGAVEPPWAGPEAGRAHGGNNERAGRFIVD